MSGAISESTVESAAVDRLASLDLGGGSTARKSHRIRRPRAHLAGKAHQLLDYLRRGSTLSRRRGLHVSSA